MWEAQPGRVHPTVSDGRLAPPTLMGRGTMNRGGSRELEKEDLIHHPVSDRLKNLIDLGINLTKDVADSYPEHKTLLERWTSLDLRGLRCGFSRT